MFILLGFLHEQNHFFADMCFMQKRPRYKKRSGVNCIIFYLSDTPVYVIRQYVPKHWQIICNRPVRRDMKSDAIQNGMQTIEITGFSLFSDVQILTFYFAKIKCKFFQQ